MAIFQRKNVAWEYFKINNCSQEKWVFLAQTKSIWDKVLRDEVAPRSNLFICEQKRHLGLRSEVSATRKCH